MARLGRHLIWGWWAETRLWFTSLPRSTMAAVQRSIWAAPCRWPRREIGTWRSGWAVRDGAVSCASIIAGGVVEHRHGVRPRRGLGAAGGGERTAFRSVAANER